METATIQTVMKTECSLVRRTLHMRIEELVQAFVSMQDAILLVEAAYLVAFASKRKLTISENKTIPVLVFLAGWRTEQSAICRDDPGRSNRSLLFVAVNLEP